MWYCIYLIDHVCEVVHNWLCFPCRIWATLDNDFPKRTKYVQACQDLSQGAAQQWPGAFLHASKDTFTFDFLNLIHHSLSKYIKITS